MRNALVILLLVSASAFATDPERAALGDKAAIARLRAQGQPGVDALMKINHREDATYRWALDQVCAQRDCAWSGLYWHTDLEEAKRLARQTGRPILSLRLLGQLDEDLSCANSRFFRTVLYSNPDIAGVLRQRYVLHWSSERPAPRVTIDYGDGRKMTRTLTGNSAHYVLDAEGRPLDVIPGLYAPMAFLGMLQEGLRIAAYPLPDLRTYHARAAQSAAAVAVAPGEGSPDARDGRLAAYSAGLRAMSKGVIEGPMLDRLYGTHMYETLARAVGGGKYIALHPNTVDLIDFKRRGSGMRNTEALTALGRALIADTRYNEYQLHVRIHQWFANDEVTTFEALNRRVYDELFLTPASDPWLGLVDEAAFTAIDGEGLQASGVSVRPAPARRR